MGLNMKYFELNLQGKGRNIQHENYVQNCIVGVKILYSLNTLLTHLKDKIFRDKVYNLAIGT